jgi:ATP-binding cassette subfamily F protein 3
MIEFRQVNKHYAGQDVLLDASFRINPGDRAGFVGPNGSGKSTVFELLSGEIQPDRGDVVLPSDLRLGYLHQQLNVHQVDKDLLGYTSRAMPEVEKLQEEMHAIEHRLPSLSGEEKDKALHRLGEHQTRFEHLGGYNLETRAREALSGLGFKESAFHDPFTSFSGGWQMRAELARTLISDPHIILLDEPSNYLDLPAVEWLQRYLRDFQGTLLLISHDRFLLESLVSITFEVSGGQITRYAGNYSEYLSLREQRREQLAAARKNQDRQREQIERFVERFRAKNTKATQVQSRIKQLEKMETIHVPGAQTSLGHLRLPDPPHSGAETASLEHVSFRYDDSNWIFQDVSLSILRGQRIALVGFNGMGKTTLLRIIAGALHPIEGKCRLGHQVIIGYQSQDFAETMPPSQTLFQVIKNANGQADDASVRSLLGQFGFSGPDVDKQVQVLSGGEKIRLAFARIFIKPPNFLLLDEPTTHLDIESREVLQKALREYDGTVCFVSHDIDFTRHVANHIIAITPTGLTAYHGGYDYYRSKVADKPQQTPASQRDTTRTDKKAERRQRAQEREALRQQTMALKKTIRETEHRIETLEAEQQELLEQMAQEPPPDFEKLNRQLSNIQQELASLNQTWEQAIEELDRLES